MRSMFVIAASAALLSLAAPSAHANEMSFGLKAGASIPMGDFKDAVGTGFLGGVYGDYGVTPQVAVGVDIVGNFYGESSDLKDAFAAAGLPDPKASITVIQFGVHGNHESAGEHRILPGEDRAVRERRVHLRRRRAREQTEHTKRDDDRATT